jgi:MerR family transcriptional regulator, light-induced transcriptional regulator
MGTVRTNAAAAMLGVSPNTLRSWERRFGYPSPQRTDGGHRQFELSEVEALRAAFEETHNISSAVSLARERGMGPATPQRLRGSLARFDEGGADRVLEESLAVRSVERTVAEVLLPGVDAMGADGASAEYGFAWRWATGWLAAAIRTAPASTREEAVVIFDASAAGDLDALHVQALELMARRRGLRTLTLRLGTDPARLSHALLAVSPSAVVLAGERASLETLSRVVYGARRVVGEGVVIADFRGALPDSGATVVPRLGDAPLAACERLAELLSRPAEAASRHLRADLRAVAAG